MDLKLAEERGYNVKREFLASRARNQLKSMKYNLLESIAQAEGVSLVPHEDQDGTIRVKLVVSKQQLRKMAMMMMGNGLSSSSLEQVLHALTRNSMKKGNGAPWRPALLSIPEEL